jgi:hypothetical protein
MSDFVRTEFLTGFPLEASVMATRSDYAFRKALDFYHSARKSAFLHKLWAKLTRKSYQLMAFPEVYEVINCYDLGHQTVEISMIKGSEGRNSDYDDAFRPLKNNGKDRWVRVAMQVWLGTGLPPVELIQVDNDYFVRDGHNRISAMRALGCKYVDAHVTCVVTFFNLASKPRAVRMPLPEFIIVDL